MNPNEKPFTLTRLLIRILWKRLFLPAAILAGVLIGYDIYNIAVNIHEDQSKTTTSIAGRIEDYLNNAYQVLDAAAIISQYTSTQDLQRDLDTLLLTNPFFDTIYTINPQGHVSAIAPYDARYIDLDMSNQEYFKNRNARPNHSLSQPFISPKTGSLTVYLIKDLINGGVVVGELSLNELQRILDDNDFTRNGQQVFITDLKGTLLAHPDSNLVAQQANINFIRQWSLQPDTFLPRIIIDGDKLYFENQHTVENTNWAVTAEYPIQVVYSSFLLSAGAAGIVFMIISVVMIWSLGKESTRKIINPITRLSEKAHALTRGTITDLSPTISRVPPSFVEVQELADNFEHMYRAIQDRQRAITESEKKYRRLIEQSNDVIYVEYQNRLVIINPKFTEVFGIQPSEIEQSPIGFSHFVTEETRNTLVKNHEAIQKQEVANLQFELTAINQDGNKILFEASLAQYPFQGGIAVQSVLRDITDRKRAEQSERDQRILAESLRDTAAVLNSSIEFDLVVHRILSNVGRVVPHTSSTVMLIDKDGETVHIVAQKGYDQHNIEGWVKTFAFQLQKTANLKYMYETGKPIIIPDTRKYPGWIDSKETDWLISYIGAPIRVQGMVIGFLSLDSESLNFFSQDQAERLLAFADQAGIAINNARMMQDLQNSHNELTTAYDTTLLGWSKALELRDYETQGHSFRVTAMTIKLAQHLGISGQDLNNIRYGSLLHDIGKIGIPDSILFKRGPLTEAEWRTMRLHPIYAEQVLSHIPYLASAVDIPYYHHEHWDGSGYPHGLSGEQIPLAARIFTIVDVWDSLSSHRPYHTSWPRDKVIQYLKDQSGKLFDPSLVEQFIDLIQNDTSEETPE